MKQTKDKPGTIRVSADGDYAFLTPDTDEAPWMTITKDGRRYFSSHDEVQGWDVRDSC